MFWAGFGYRYCTGLVPLEGRVNGQGICDLYESFLPDFVEEGDIFMHNNAPVYTAAIVSTILE